MNMKTALDYFLFSKRSEGLKPYTVEKYERFICKFCETLPEGNQTAIDAVTSIHVKTFIGELTAVGYADATVKHYFVALSSFFNLLVLDDDVELTKSPLAKIKTPRVKQKIQRVAPIEDVYRLLDSIKHDDWPDYRDKAIIQVLIDAGLRCSELVRLDVADVDTQNNVLRVREPKNGKDRFTPLSATAKKAIIVWLFVRPQTKEAHCAALFTSRGNSHGLNAVSRLTTSGVRLMIKRRCMNAGVPVMNVHSFRHAFACKAIRDGVRIETVSKALGHSDVGFTARTYAKLDTQTMVDEFAEHWQSRD